MVVVVFIIIIIIIIIVVVVVVVVWEGVGGTVIGLSCTASPAFFSLSVRCFHIVKLSEINIT